MKLGPSLLFLVSVVAAAFAMGCTPQVGDSCVLSTDCGSTGQLVCDTSEFEGYCTFVDCQGNACPDNAGCINFYPAIPGCGYNDRQAGSRFSQPFCMATCSSNSDCRDGYICADPTLGPWFAQILDSNQTEEVCLPSPSNGQVGGSTPPDSDAAVCSMSGPPDDAGFPPLLDAAGDTGFEAGADAGTDGKTD